MGSYGVMTITAEAATIAHDTTSPKEDSYIVHVNRPPHKSTTLPYIHP